ncbi:MAG TPA: response regulator transcription factor [Kofleriaceae bacterium]|nr:response regulator transcription factor [Kofleriaceae bacterium]
MPEPIRVLLVDDHEVVLVGIRKEIEADPQLALVGTARRLVEAKPQLARDPHVAVIDLNLGKDGNGAGLQLVREIRASHPRIGAVIFSHDGDDDSVADAMKAGAWGYVSKECPLSQLLAAIKRVAGGERNVRYGVGPAGVARPALTRRELEVLELVASGWSSQDIARALHLERRTVESHRAGLMTKLGASNAADLVDRAYRLGYLPRARHERNEEADDPEDPD